MEARNTSDQEQENLAGDAMEAVGEPAAAADEVNESHESVGHDKSNDPLYVQKRLKQQKRAHEREMREMQARISELQSRVNQPSQASDQMMNPYGQSNGSPIDEQIHKAVSYALQHKEMEERKAKDAEKMAHVNRQYVELNKHLDSASDKYDDFDDVVRSPDAKYSTHMRDAALFLPKVGPGSAAEVLYKLGKNPSELERIASLHPLDQASEMVKLSHALISGGDNKRSQPQPLGQIKSNPANHSHNVTDKTPVGELRRRMKAGWK